MDKKSIYIMCLIFSSLMLNVNAQESNSEFGVKGGLNLSNIINEDISDQNTRVGYHAGLFFKLSITDFLALQPELLYTAKGATTEYDNFITGEGQFEQKLDYLEIPVLAVVNLTDNLHLHAGPYFSYLMNASVENNSANADFNFIEELDEDDFNRFDYGLSAGLGFEFDIFRFGIRYDYGMKKIGKEQDFAFQESELLSDNLKDNRNSALMLYLGIGF